jgi:hypothetical protein
MPALRAPLCCSPVAGRQKLVDAQTGLAPYSATSSAARRHQTGGTQYARSLFRYGFSERTIFKLLPGIAAFLQNSAERWHYFKGFLLVNIQKNNTKFKTSW